MYFNKVFSRDCSQFIDPNTLVCITDLDVLHQYKQTRIAKIVEEALIYSPEQFRAGQVQVSIAYDHRFYELTLDIRERRQICRTPYSLLDIERIACREIQLFGMIPTKIALKNHAIVRLSEEVQLALAGERDEVHQISLALLKSALQKKRHNILKTTQKSEKREVRRDYFLKVSTGKREQILNLVVVFYPQTLPIALTAYFISDSVIKRRYHLTDVTYGNVKKHFSTLFVHRGES